MLLELANSPLLSSILGNNHSHHSALRFGWLLQAHSVRQNANNRTVTVTAI